MYSSTYRHFLACVGVVTALSSCVDAFTLSNRQPTAIYKVSSSSQSASLRTISTSSSSLHSSNNDVERYNLQNNDQTTIQPMSESKSSLPLLQRIPSIAMSTFLSFTVAATVTTSPTIVHAYEATDYASETVTQAVQSVRKAAGNADATLQEFENIAEIITEGKGVGGSINYSGVQLERGYVADEDTTIYNPGLSLLTESEKERLVEAIQLNRKDSLTKCSSPTPTTCWTESNEEAYSTLKGKLDPYHMTELRGYLSIAPFYGAFLYLASLAVQQFQRDWFSAAYIVSAVAFFLPIAVLIASS